jgi:sugar phosphate isomerase/epimerase
MDSLAGFVDAASTLDIPLCIENMFPAYGDWYTPNSFQDIFDRFPALRMTLDTGHANISHPDNGRLRKLVEKYADRIDHIHISDNSGKADEHLPVGAGTVDFQWLAGRLNEMGYDSTVTLEVFSEDRQLVKESKKKFKALMIQYAP